jgi:nitroreductase
MQALRERSSCTGFSSQEVSADVVLSLCWAAWGVNRADSGKRTAPTARNRQEMDLYVILPDGAYFYDPQGHALAPVASGDLRSTAVGGWLKDGPVQLIMVADYARGGSDRARQELHSNCHCGFIGQNIYLFCAAHGLGTRFYASIDKEALKGVLKLRPAQEVLYGQAVGWPA